MMNLSANMDLKRAEALADLTISQYPCPKGQGNSESCELLYAKPF